MNHYKSIATRLSILFDENEKINLARISRQQTKIDELEYKLKVAEAKLSQTTRLLTESEKQRTKALELLDRNEYRNY